MTITTNSESDAIVIEAYCALFGYDPESGMTQEEFTVDRIKTQQIAATVRAYRESQAETPSI